MTTPDARAADLRDVGALYVDAPVAEAWEALVARGLVDASPGATGRAFRCDLCGVLQRGNDADYGSLHCDACGGREHDPEPPSVRVLVAWAFGPVLLAEALARELVPGALVVWAARPGEELAMSDRYTSDVPRSWVGNAVPPAFDELRGMGVRVSRVQLSPPRVDLEIAVAT